MYKGVILYLVPIFLGLIIGFILKKVNSYKTIYSLILSILLSGIYLAIISAFTSSKNETQLLIILLIWYSLIAFISSKICLYFYGLKKTKS